MTTKQDKEADNFLAQDGDRYFIDEKGELEVIFKVRIVKPTAQMPHGFKYSLVLLDANGNRLVGFDNTLHTIEKGRSPSKKQAKHYDHKHVGDKTTIYKFTNPQKLVADFWKQVDKFV